MKKNSRQLTLTYLLLISFSLTSISQIYEVDMDEYYIKYYGKYTRRVNDPTMVLNNIEANYKGAIRIGTVYSKKSDGKKLMGKIAKLGGDFYSIDYEKETIKKTGRMPSGSYSQEYGAKTDYSYKIVTTHNYEEVTRYKSSYAIPIYRIFDEDMDVGLFDLMKGCYFCYSTYVKPQFFKKYITKVENVNLTRHGVPYFYYFIKCIIGIGGISGESCSLTEEMFEGEYSKLEMLLEAGLNPNIIQKVAFKNWMEDFVPYALWIDDTYDSPLKMVSESIRWENENLDPQNLDSWYRKDSEEKLLQRRRYVVLLQKVESLLIEYGARNFQGEELKREN